MNLKLINLFLQIFFIRLTKCTQDIAKTIDIQSYDLTPHGISARGIGKTTAQEWYSIQYWILPFSGWKKDFIILNKESKFKRISKIKEYSK